MNKRFEKRLAYAKNPRARRINRKLGPKASPKHFRTNVEAVIDKLTGNGDGGGLYDSNPNRMARNLTGAAMAPVLAIGELAIAAIADHRDKKYLLRDEQARLKRLHKRQRYYDADARRREEERELIKAAAVPPTHPLPTPKALMDAYVMRHEDDAHARAFGELMIDLEEHVRRQYAITGNKFTGSSGGVKDWLKANCPFLAAHYGVCQRYKRIAQGNYCT